MLHRRRTAAVVVAVVTVLITGGVAGCSGSPIPKPTTSPGPPLPELARARGLALGAGVPEFRMNAGRYQAMVKSNFTSITPQNALKWERTEPEQGQFDFRQADPLVQFAVAQHLRVRGCCLAWHLQNPNWLTSGTFTAAQATAILREHIHTVVGRYKGKIAQWDVTNEVFRTVHGGRVVPYPSVWLRTIGSGYVAEAFRAAHEADPSALLFANEFGNDGKGPHLDAFYNMVRKLKADGVPIHGVGLQMHRGFGHPTPAEVYAAMQKYAALGLRVEITEMDVPLALPPDAAMLQRQGQLFRQMTATCLRVAACTGITFWGVDDNDRYRPLIRNNRGAMTMFDQRGKRKPAYDGVAAALLAANTVTDRLSPGQPAG